MICRSSALLRVSSVALIAALTPIAAQAQTGVQSGASADDCRADPTQPSGATNVIPGCASEPRGSGGEIVVTGSRIRLPNLQSLEPTLTVSREYFEDRNLTNVADALNETPTFRGSVTPNGAQGSYGQGVNFVNNFGLGSNRTLTLVNGRRFVTSNVTTLFNQGSAGSQVDLNVIPTILVSRVDTVDIGGAPVYGSDAISGVVNIILRDRFTGVEATALSGITEEGDGFRYNGSLLIGHDYFDGRANLTVSYSRDVQDGVTYNSRDFLRANYINVTNPSTTQAAGLGRPAGTTFANDGRLNPNIGFNDTASDGFPGSVAIRNGTIYYLNQGGLITSATGNGAAAYNYQFDTSGNLVPYNTGIRFVGINASGGDGFQFNDYSQITSQVKRDTLNAFAHFDVSDAFKLFFEGEYFHSRGDELVQQPTFNSNLFGGASGPLTFTNNSPFLTAQARAQLTALGITRFQISRASADLADLTGFSTTNLGRAVLGARGDFQIGSRNFNYEVSANYGRN
ncbi:MAG: TonB-dependent receptor plug domain-containing protein, partial [Sphingomonas bacterium]|nr:TonB-dependent receptor plug domain-containing protein [Sphingomonas bacterium]